MGPREDEVLDGESEDTSKQSRPLRRGCCGLPPVRHARHAPSFQQIPHIKRGYRIGFSPMQLLRSLFTLHNQSGNTWTHLLGAGYVSYVLFVFLCTDRHGLHPMGTIEWLVLLTFLCSALTCLLFSTLYHLLGCASPRLYEVLFRADLIGIALLIFGSYVPGIYYAYYCFPALQFRYMVITVTNLCVGLLSGALTDLHCPKQSRIRTLSFAFLVAFGLVPAIHWCFIAPHKVRVMFIDNLGGMFACYGLGFAFWTTRFPEAYIPNRFDLLFSSHQLWHICIVAAVVVWLHGILEYHDVLHTDSCSIFDLP